MVQLDAPLTGDLEVGDATLAESAKFFHGV